MDKEKQFSYSINNEKYFRNKKKNHDIININSQTIDLSTYDELISKTRQNILKFKKDFKEIHPPFITFNNSSISPNILKSKSYLSLNSARTSSKDKNIISINASVNDEMKINPYKPKNFKITPLKKDLSQEKYYKALYESMKTDFVINNNLPDIY